MLVDVERATTRLRRWTGTPTRIWVVAVLAVYGLLVISGVTTTSIAIEGLRDHPADVPAGLIAGGPDPIRSDEFLRTTPWRIGLSNAGGDSFGTALAHPDPALVTNGEGGAATYLLFPDTALLLTVGRVAPIQAFAAVWWLPVAMLSLLLPVWFRQFGVRLRISGPLTVLVVLSPVSIWWSWTALTGMAFALLAAVAAYAGVSRGRAKVGNWGTTGLLLLGGLALARLALSYQPWAIPLGAAVLVPTACVLLQPKHGRGRALLLMIIILMVSGVALLGFFAEHREGLRVLTSTVYPGSRRFSGSLTGLGLLFGAPNLWVLHRTPTLVGTNQSEVSSAYTVLAAVCLAMVPAIDWKRARRVMPAVISSGAIFILLAAWCTMDWPDRASYLFPLSLVSPGRLVQVLGLAATLTFGLVYSALAEVPRVRRIPISVMVVLIAVLGTAAGGSAIRQAYLPTMRTLHVAGTAVMVGLVLGIAILAAGRRWALLPAAAAAVPVVILVNPIQVGFADLSDGSSASIVEAAAADLRTGSRWATDDIYADALLMSNGLASLSGQQWIGPNKTAWRKLDPHGEYEDLWNRGAAYVRFDWSAPNTSVEVTLPSPDLIIVRADPCSAALARLGLGIVVASKPLNHSCLALEDEFTLGGVDRWIYEVDRS